MGTCPVNFDFKKIIGDALEIFIRLLIHGACEESGIDCKLNIERVE